MAQQEEDTSYKLSSVKYYQLNNENAYEFYDEWWFKTFAIIRKRGWDAIFEVDPSTSTPTKAQAEEASATEAIKELYKSNNESYDQVLMGCSGTPLGLVQRAKGDVRDAIKRLASKFANENQSDLTSLINDFTNCKLESTETDPDVWFLKLDAINDKLRNINEEYAKRDYEVKAHLLGNLPEDYSEVVTKLTGKEQDHSINDIEKEITSKWKRSFKDGTIEKKNNLAMSVDQGRVGRSTVKKRKNWHAKPFKGRCRKCGKTGHKKSDCTSDKEGVCFNCGEDGHFAKDCPKKNATAGTGMFVGMTYVTKPFCSNCKVRGHNANDCDTGHFIGMVEHAYKATTRETTNERNRYLLDSGASTHVVGCGDGLLDPSTSKQTVRVGNGATMKATKQGTMFLRNEDSILKLSDVQVVPGFVKNVISLGRLPEAGYKIHFEGNDLQIEAPSGHQTVVTKNDEGLYYLNASVAHRHEVHPTLIEEDDLVPTQMPKKPTKKQKQIDINDAHELYGHLNHGILQPLLTTRGYIVHDGGKNKKTCEACAYAKAKAKGVSKTTHLKATEKGERLFLDISGPYKMSLKGSKYWLLIVDDKTRKAWSFFVKTKAEARRATAALLTLLKGARVVTKYLRCDNAGENVKGLKELCHENGIKIELTPPNSPQFNGVVERKFVTLRDRAQAMMLGARLDDHHQGRLWAEAVYTATRLHNAVPNRTGAAPDEQWYGAPPVIHDHLVQFGRIGYVTIRDKQPKMKRKSTKMIFMGYADDHAGDVYRMYNPETHRIIESRDVTWAQWHGSQDIPASLKLFAAPDIVVDRTDDQIEEGPPHAVVSDDEEPDTGAGRKSSSTPAPGPRKQRIQEMRAAVSSKPSRLERELSRLNTYYNPVSNVVEEEEEEKSTTEDTHQVEVHYVFNATLASDPGEPKSLGEALRSPERLKWIEATKKEIENFLKRKVWKPVPLSDLKGRQRPISTKWVYKIKNEHDGSKRYKGRIVVRGFVQIPGVDFNLTHSPVATDVSIRTVLALALYYESNGWETEMLDIEAAFLEAQLDEDVYIEWPEGVVMFGYIPEHETKGTCLRLERAMYGTVQAPLAFWKECAKHLRKIGMTQSKADPCVWYKWKDGKLWMTAAVYVDDIVYAGPETARQWFKTEIKSRFKIAELGRISKHLGVWYSKKSDDQGSYYEMSMSDYQTDIVNDWMEATGKEPKPAPTPGFPGESLVRNTEEEIVDIENYRKILGKVMWFCRKIMPECSNAVRELASSMDRPGVQHWKALGRLVEYIMGCHPATLILRRPIDLKLYAYVDSNWASNKETRKSVTGYIVTLGGAPLNFVSRSQQSVSLSSTEAEYMAASVCATEIQFIQMLVTEIVPDAVVRPATLLEDNTGAIYLMENQAVGNRTKHIDIRAHHIRELMQGEDPRLRVCFVRSEMNFADLMTKNVTEKIHNELVPALKNGDIARAIFEIVNREDVEESNGKTDGRSQLTMLTTLDRDTYGTGTRMLSDRKKILDSEAGKTKDSNSEADSNNTGTHNYMCSVED